MIRLVIYLSLLGLGAWAGAEYTRNEIRNACLAAGGSIDATDVCKGVR